MQDWPGIITAFGVLVTAVVSAYIALRTAEIKAEVGQVKVVAQQTEVNTNSNLSEVKDQLSILRLRMEGIVTVLAQHPDAAALFRDVIGPIERDNPMPTPASQAPMVVPEGAVIPKGTVIPPGTVIPEGTVIPPKETP